MIEVLGFAHAQGLHFKPQHARGVLGGAVAQRHAEIGGVPQHGDARDRRQRVAQDFEALGAELGR